MFRVAIGVVGLIFLASCATTSRVPPAARSDLAPTGTLRAAINFGNPILAARDPSTGEPRGVSVDLSRELAGRLGVRVQFVTYDAAGRVVEGLKVSGFVAQALERHPVAGASVAPRAPVE